MSWKIGLIGTGNVASFWAENLSRFPSVELFVKGSKPATDITVVDSSLKSLEINSSLFPTAPFSSEVKIALRVDFQPNSSLNLFK